MIARETAALIARPAPVIESIPVAISARHVHLDQATVEALFGPGYQLTPETPLRQPGQWAAKERVALVGPKNRIERVAILGPTRKRNQIEVSRTDSFALGVQPPVRDSGKLDGTPSITIVGPAGEVTTDGLILAARHIHTNPADAARLGLEDGEHVDVEVGEGRELTFSYVLIRVGADSFTEMHIDTDEANAAGISGNDTPGEIIQEPALTAPATISRKPVG